MAEDTPPRSFRLGSTRNVAPPASPSPEPGRRSAAPKSQRPMAAAKDVDRAVALLDSMYAILGDGMDLFALEDTRAKWEEAVPKLRRTNRDSLSASPKLARSIANLGEGGGATTFFLMHVFILAGIVPTARRELAANLAARPARHAAPSPSEEFDWDGAAASAFAGETGATMPGGYNVGEHIPGLG